MSKERRAIRIGNCSGFFGDRVAAAREMVDGGPLDVLIGDWLAELTMLILAKQKDGTGYARTFVAQMEQVLEPCLTRGIKVVSNAGGLDPHACAQAVADIAAARGLSARIAVVTGDNLMPRIDELRAGGETFVNMDTGETLAEAGLTPLTANAYLGGRPIAQALAGGADIVITGRVTDAALVVGPAIWWHDWPDAPGTPADLDALAGAVLAGHVIECGAQASGGNYAFFTEVPGLEHPGFPIAEVDADGSSVITKHPGTGGMVTVGTVTAQLLYEIGAPAYLNPDVVSRIDTAQLTQIGTDRVRLSGARGEAAPARVKVAMNGVGGYRNTMTLVITGADVEAKADIASRGICGVSLEQARTLDPRALAAASTLDVRELEIDLRTTPFEDPITLAQAQSHLRITVKADDTRAAGRAFSTRVIEATLSSYPGFFTTTPPTDASAFGIYWPTTVDATSVPAHVELVEVTR